jgi:hypothetical protein
LLEVTRPELLVETSPKPKPTIEATSLAAQAMLEQETDLLIRELKAVEESYGTDMLTLSIGGFLTMMEEHLALPFCTSILGVDVVVEKVDMARSGQIVAICRRDKVRQRVGILDLPLPTPAPAGTEWIAAYRHWRRGF